MGAIMEASIQSRDDRSPGRAYDVPVAVKDSPKTAP